MVDLTASIARLPKPCIFVHLPKSGGSTLQEIIQRQYPSDSIYSIEGESIDSVQRSVDRLRNLPDDQRSAIACVRGHVPFGIHRWLTGDTAYVTVLRDPVERTVSDYFFARNTPGHRLYERIRANRLSLEDFAVLRHQEGLGNIYCRMLGGAVDWNRLRDSPLETTPDTLDAAKRNLECHFAAVGLTERFDVSLLLMQDALGWGNVLYRRTNVTRDKPARVLLTVGERDAIHRLNALDIELYSFARQRMDALVTAGGEELDRRLRRFRRANALYQQWRAVRRAAGAGLRSLGMRR